MENSERNIFFRKSADFLAQTYYVMMFKLGSNTLLLQFGENLTKRHLLGWVQNTLLSPIFKVALMEVPMGTQSTHTKFGAPRPHQFFGAGPQSFTT